MAERARTAAPRAEVRVGNASTLNFDDGSFDVVLSSFVVFFMEDPTAALREWRRVLAPEGRLVMATWNGGDPRWSWERDVRMPFISDIGPGTLEEIMAAVGLIARFDEPAKVEDELRVADFTPEAIEPHAIDFTFETEDAWWEWNWSHGARVFLEALSAESQERFRGNAYDAMQALRTDDGFPRRFTAIFSRADGAPPEIANS